MKKKKKQLHIFKLNKEHKYSLKNVRININYYTNEQNSYII